MSHHVIYKHLTDHINKRSADSQQRMTDHAMRGNWQGAAAEYQHLDHLGRERPALFKTHRAEVLKNLGGK